MYQISYLFIHKTAFLSVFSFFLFNLRGSLHTRARPCVRACLFVSVFVCACVRARARPGVCMSVFVSVCCFSFITCSVCDYLGWLFIPCYFQLTLLLN